MTQRWIFGGVLGLALCLMATTAAQTPNSSIPFTVTDANNLPLSGTSVVLQLPTFNTATVSGPTSDQGKTVVSTGNIPPQGVIVDFYRCPNANVTGVAHDAAAPCNGAKMMGTAPVVPGVTKAVTIGENGVSAWTSDTTFVVSDSNGSGNSVFINDQEAYNLTDDPTDPQSYTVYVNNNKNGPVSGLSGVPPSAIGQSLTQLQTAYGHNPGVLVQGPTSATPIPVPNRAGATKARSSTRAQVGPPTPATSSSVNAVGTPSGSQAPANELQAVANVLASNVFTAEAGAALSELAGGAPAGPQATLSSFPVTVTNANNQPQSGTSVVLQLPNFDTGTVSSPTDDKGGTVVHTGNIPPGGVIVTFYRCPGNVVKGVEHDAAAPCDGAKLAGTAPVVPGVTKVITISENGVTASISDTTFVASDGSDTTVFINGQEAYSLTDNPGDPQSYSVYVNNGSGATQTGVSGVPPIAVGRTYTQLKSGYSHNPPVTVGQGSTQATPPPAPKPAPVAQQTPTAPAPGTYVKPPRRSVKAKCPECQKYANDFNRIAGYIDDDWQKKISLQRGVDIGRSVIQNQQNQLAALQQQGPSSDPVVQQQIAKLQKDIAGHQQNEREDLAKIQNLDRGIANYSDKLRAAEAAFDACKCPEPTKTAQVPPLTPAPSGKTPTPAPQPKPGTDSSQTPPSQPVNVATALGLTGTSGTLPKESAGYVSAFGYRVDVGGGATWETRGDGSVVFTYSIAGITFTSVFTASSDGSITVTPYENGHPEKISGERQSSQDEQDEEDNKSANNPSFKGLVLASKPDIPNSTTINSITTPSGKGYVETNAWGDRQVVVTAQDGSTLTLSISHFNTQYVLTQQSQGKQVTVAEGEIPPHTDFTQFINSKLDEAQNLPPPPENPDYDTGHYDNFDPFHKPAPSKAEPTPPEKPGTGSEDATKTTNPTTTGTSATTFGKDFGLRFHLNYDTPRKALDYSCRLRFLENPVAPAPKPAFVLTCPNASNPSGPSFSTTFFSPLAYDPAFYNIFVNQSTSNPSVFLDSFCKQGAGGRIHCDINSGKIPRPRFTSLQSIMDIAALYPLLAEHALEEYYDGPSAYHISLTPPDPTDTSTGTQFPFHVDLIPEQPGTAAPSGTTSVVNAITFLGDTPSSFALITGNTCNIFSHNEFQSFSCNLTPKQDRIFVIIPKTGDAPKPTDRVYFTYSYLTGPNSEDLQILPDQSVGLFNFGIAPSTEDPAKTTITINPTASTGSSSTPNATWTLYMDVNPCGGKPEASRAGWCLNFTAAPAAPSPTKPDQSKYIPDVSLFASNGSLGSFYIITQADLPGSLPRSTSYRELATGNPTPVENQPMTPSAPPVKVSSAATPSTAVTNSSAATTATPGATERNAMTPNSPAGVSVPASHHAVDIVPKPKANPRPYLQFEFKDVQVTNITTSNSPEASNETLTFDYSKIEYNYPAKPVKRSGQNVALEGLEAEVAMRSPSGEGGSDASLHRPSPARDGSRRRGTPYLQLAAFHSGDALKALPPGTVVRLVPRAHSNPPAAAHHSPQTPAQTIVPIAFSLVANGNSSGEAFELRVVDPTGKLREIRAPDGLILEPLERGSAKPVSAAPGKKLVSHKLNAYCVDYAKDPPESEAIYRVAAPEIQEQYRPIRAVMRAGRELAAAGKFHPDSDATAYNIAIRQYAIWTKLENWNEEKFGEVFLEKTRKIAVDSKVGWDKEMDQALRALIPGRWRDISMVLAEARTLEASSQDAGAPPAPGR